MKTGAERHFYHSVERAPTSLNQDVRLLILSTPEPEGESAGIQGPSELTFEE